MKKLPYDFFLDETLHIAKEGEVGQQGAHKPPWRGLGGGRAVQACGHPLAPLWHFFGPVFFINPVKNTLRFLRRLELRRIGISTLLLFQARIPAADILPLHVNLAK